jgi:hypothetical protein
MLVVTKGIEGTWRVCDKVALNNVGLSVQKITP